MASTPLLSLVRSCNTAEPCMPAALLFYRCWMASNLTLTFKRVMMMTLLGPSQMQTMMFWLSTVLSGVFVLLAAAAAAAAAKMDHVANP